MKRQDRNLSICSRFGLKSAQMRLLIEKCRQKGGDGYFIHMFLMKLKLNGIFALIQLNYLDNEYYVFQNRELVFIAFNTYELKGWLAEHLFQDKENRDFNFEVIWNQEGGKAHYRCY